LFLARGFLRARLRSSFDFRRTTVARVPFIRALREAAGRYRVGLRVCRLPPKIGANMAPTVFSCRQIERNVD
jgi:hypothetical protein